MPLHGYTTDRRPPSNLDHLYAHPYSIGISALQTVACVIIVVSTVLDVQVSQAMARLPEGLLFILSALLLVGGGAIIRGLLDDSDDLMVGWKIERTGLILSGTAWIVFGYTIWASFHAAVLAWLWCGVLGVCHAIRYRATVLEEKRVRERVAQHEQTTT